MNSIPNRKVICDTLVRLAENDKSIIVLASDSRGSAKMQAFVDKFPKQFIEVGIAEQNIVGIAAGLAASGKKPFVVSPASFLSMRSIEQIKVDVAYSNTNVKLVGISGGVSYGALGMSHHSVQDLAVMKAIPGIKVMMPADRFETEIMTEELVKEDGPAYIRIGRNPVEDVYKSYEDISNKEFKLGKSILLNEGDDITIIASGETVKYAVDSAEKLKKNKINARVIDMHTIKPLDEEAIIKAAKETKNIITLEEHSIYGGLGGAVAEVVVQNYPVNMKIIGIADEPAIPGESPKVFEHYGISVDNIVKVTKKMLNNSSEVK